MDFDDVFSIIAKILLIVIETCVATFGVCMAIMLIRWVIAGVY